MKHSHKRSNAPSNHNRNAQRLDAFWRKALAAAPETPIDTTKLGAARAAILAAAEQHSTANKRSARNPWHALKTWWSAGAKGFAPPRWATGLASIILASLVLVLWYERMPEPAWDFDSATVGHTAAPAQAVAPAPQSERAPAAAMAPRASASANERAATAARKAPDAHLQTAPSAPMAKAPASKAATQAHDLLREPAPPMPAPLAEAARTHEAPSASVTLYGGQADIANAIASEQNHALLAQLQASDGIAWRANARSLFAALNAAQTTALLSLLEPLAQQAVALPQPNKLPEPLALLQRNSQQLLIKQANGTSLIAHLVGKPHYQIDWFNTRNEWLASTPMDEAAYNRITTTITAP